MTPQTDSTAVEIHNLSRQCHRALILSILSTGPHHGYQLALELEEKSGGAFGFNHGTLYPILHRLEREGLIVAEWKQAESGRSRKYYRIESEGRKELKQQTKQWQLVNGVLGKLMSIA